MKKKKDYGIAMRFPSEHEKPQTTYGYSKELIIQKDENTIIQIRKENIQEVKYQPKYTYKGFTHCLSLQTFETFTPVYTEPESWYVIMTNGSKIDLTEKQYKTIKGWF